MAHQSPESALEHHERLIQAEESLRHAFRHVGIEPDDADKLYCKWLAHWYNGSPYSNVLFQDIRSRKLITKIASVAGELHSLLSEAFEYSGLGSREPDVPITKINVCENFYGDTGADSIDAVGAIIEQACSALKIGRTYQGRGQPPKLDYYDFILQLHHVYFRRAGKKGFYEKGSSAHGPFVDFVVEAQQILPDGIRLTERVTIANRILQAFTVGNTTRS